MAIIHPFFAPPPPHELVAKRRAIKSQLLEQSDLLDKRIAILSGSTTTEIQSLLEIKLLDCGIRPTFYASDYNRYYEDALFGNPDLDAFSPDVILIHTTSRNITNFPSPKSDKNEIGHHAKTILARFTAMWEALGKKFNCAIIQNNFDPLQLRPLSGFDGIAQSGSSRLINILNEEFAQAANKNNSLIIHDINRLAAESGLDVWHDAAAWFAYKCTPGTRAVPQYTHSVTSILRATFGKSSKCLVLDLDNTLWGGVIGDDGVNGIRLGQGSAEGEAYLSFQTYIKKLKERGIILAVCSKNEHESALEGLNHPDSVLRPDDFA